MLTVKEFEILGVQYYNGDTAVDLYGNNYTQEWHFLPSIDWSDYKIVKFAWRPINTLPDNPRFKYELKGNHSWRPLLDQANMGGLNRENIAVNRDDVPSFAFKTEPVFCDKCGDSCMHDGVNYIGVALDVTGTPDSLKSKMPSHRLNICYPCWINGMMGGENEHL